MPILGVFSSPISTTVYLVESWLPKPVFPEQQWPGRGSHQGAVFIRFYLPRPGPAPFLGTQVEEE